MTYTSIHFVFFLAFGLFAYALVPESRRVHVLCVMNLIWYASWNLAWGGLILAISLANYGWLKKNATRAVALDHQRGFYLRLISFDILVLILLKSLPLLKSAFPHFYLHPNPMPGTQSLALEDLLASTPYGISFFMFMLLAFVIDTWRGAIKEPPRRFAEFFTAIAFFPLLLAGPIERFTRLGPQLRRLGPLESENMVDGILIFSLGYVKKTWAGDGFARSVASVFDGRNISFATLSLAGLLGTFQAYVDFSSYCDMGRGAARCFGIKLGPNFLPFYFSKNPNEFWQRWNLSLGAWIRDYLTLPALLLYRSPPARYAILALAFVIVGLWHRFYWHWFFFGLYNGLMIVAFLFCQNNLFLRRPAATRWLGLILVLGIFVGNGLLQNSQIGQVFSKALAGFPFWGDTAGLLSLLSGMADLAPVFAFILVVDCLQERERQSGSCVRLPLWARSLLAMAMVAGFFFTQNQGRTVSAMDLGPMYFHF